MDTLAITQKLYDTTGPRPVRVWLGGRQLALSILRNAFEDCMGRSVGVYGNRQKERRLNASNSIKWLRQAGRLSVRGKAIPADLRHEYVLSIDWCAEVLDVDAKQLASDGIHCIPNSGLRNWRRWRSQRNENRREAHPIRDVRCAFCLSQHCSNAPNDNLSVVARLDLRLKRAIHV